MKVRVLTDDCPICGNSLGFLDGRCTRRALHKKIGESLLPRLNRKRDYLLDELAAVEEQIREEETKK